MFDDEARILVKAVSFECAPELTQRRGGTSFAPALTNAETILQETTCLDLIPIIILMTDGECSDMEDAKDKIVQIDAAYRQYDLQVHLVAFGDDADMTNLEVLKDKVTKGTIHKANIGELAVTFKEIEQSIVVAEHFI
jgi:uncharacterized protein YegL